MIDLSEIEKDQLAAQCDTDKIAHLKACAKHVAEVRLDNDEAMVLLRGRAADIKLSIQNSELRTFHLEAQRGRVTELDLVRPGQKLSSRSAPFLLEGVFMPNTTNLVVAREKKGKTTFVIAWIAAWHYGCSTFINQRIHGELPPVFIIGPDMPEEDWFACFRQYHLIEEDGTLPEDGPIKGLLHKGHQIRLDSKGVDLIESIAAGSPGALFIFDSYSELTSEMGLGEERSEFADPLRRLQKALAPHHCTLVVLHHSAANRDTGKASSRGTTALPAAVSQTIFMESPNNEDGETRIQIRTSGRSRGFKSLVRKEEADGSWVCLADGAGLVEQQQREKAITKLTQLQRQVLDGLVELREQEHDGSDYRSIAVHLGFGGQDADRMRGPVKALCGRGLAIEMPIKQSESREIGRTPHRFRVRQNVVDLVRQGGPGAL